MSCLILHKITHEPTPRHPLFLEAGLTAPLLGLAGSTLDLVPLCVAPWPSPATELGKKWVTAQTIKPHQLAMAA